MLDMAYGFAVPTSSTSLDSEFPLGPDKWKHAVPVGQGRLGRAGKNHAARVSGGKKEVDFSVGGCRSMTKRSSGVHADEFMSNGSGELVRLGARM